MTSPAVTPPDLGTAPAPVVYAAPRPPLVRRPEDRVVAGVCDAVARHLTVGVLPVRVVFVVLVPFAGSGVMAYAALWVFMPQERGTGASRRAGIGSGRDRARGVALLLLGLGGLLLAAQMGLVSPATLLPLLLAGAGVAVIWRQIDEGRRPADRAGWWRLVGGAALLLSGLTVFLIAANLLTAARQALFVILVVVLGLAVVSGPWWRRLVVELGIERRERIRTQERAEVAAHLHDSVLQTLALIQRHVDSPREVARLARGQERELRSWLYGRAPEAASRFAAAMEALAADVEDTYAVAVEAVLVGDCDVDPGVAALLQAAREAAVNAARHAGVDTVSVYGEVETQRVVAYVRDRGVGFDPATVPADRHGIRGSIEGRMARVHGRAEVRSTQGAGTEVVLSVARAGAAAASA